MVKVKKRRAIAMIELIFSIVIIGIVLMSVPMLVKQASESGYVAIQQEAINAAASEINMIMAYHWDENDTNESFYDTVLSTGGGDSNLSEFGSFGHRPGSPNETTRTYIAPSGVRLSATPPASLGKDGALEIADDIDDFSDTTVHLTGLSPSSADYIETSTIDIDINVSYIPDNPGGGSYVDPGADHKITFSPSFTSSPSTTSTNIKRITVELTSSSGVEELEKDIILHAFSCNIGSYMLEKKEF